MKSPSRTAREYPTTGSQGEPDDTHFRPFRSVTVNFTWGVIGKCSRRVNLSQSCAITLDSVAQTPGRSNPERRPQNGSAFAKTGAAPRGTIDLILSVNINELDRRLDRDGHDASFSKTSKNQDPVRAVAFASGQRGKSR
jgi:hypothetical protein